MKVDRTRIISSDLLRFKVAANSNVLGNGLFRLYCIEIAQSVVACAPRTAFHPSNTVQLSMTVRSLDPSHLDLHMLIAKLRRY